MQRFVNNPDFIVDDMLKGLVKANPEVRFSEENDHVISMKEMKKGKVGVITGGGSGHEPAFVGYLGDGMLDSVAIGEVFASPPALAFYDAIVDADQGEGVAVLFGNYAGDNMNVKMAVQMAEDDDIEVKYVVANDDVASAPKAVKEQRHGIAGGFFMWKVGGARAAKGGSLDFEEGKEVAVMLSSLGATPVMELYVLYDEVEKVLAKAGHKVWKTYIGNYVTSLDMNGASLTIVDLDDEIKELLSEPAVPIGMKNY